jgi:DNA-directed RNA polymerase specialized sigma24 family protein
MKTLLVISASPTSPEGGLFVSWLRSVERTGHGWDDLFEALNHCCEQLARRFADITSLAEVRSDCYTLTYERYVGEWIETVASNEQKKSFDVYVHDRLHEHLRARRRKDARHDALVRNGSLNGYKNGHVEVQDPRDDTGVIHVAPVHVGDVSAPDEPLRWRQLMARVAVDAALTEHDRDALVLLVHGHTQTEIARLLDLTEPTVSRMCQRLRTLFHRHALE